MHPLKEWLRQHPQHVSAGLDATGSTSHQLRDGLKKQGWTVQERETEVGLLMPGQNGSSRIDDVLGSEDERDAVEPVDVSFGLESQLRDFLAQNLSSIPIKSERLSLYVDPTGRDGVEYPTGVGPIDILSIDDVGNFVVLELKRARSPDYAIGQLARYMGWVKHTIGRGKEVRGIIVAKTIDEKLRFASSVIPNVSLLEYEVEFHVRSADTLPS